MKWWTKSAIAFILSFLHYILGCQQIFISRNKNEMNLLPTYFIHFFWKIIIKNNFLWIKKSYYKKQTLRNRTYIHGANGKLMLSIPIKHWKNLRRYYEEVSIDSSSNWKKIILNYIKLHINHLHILNIMRMIWWDT